MKIIVVACLLLVGCSKKPNHLCEQVEGHVVTVVNDWGHETYAIYHKGKYYEMGATWKIKVKK